MLQSSHLHAALSPEHTHRFGRGSTAGFFYTVVNATPKPGAKAKPSDRKSFVSQWDGKTWKLIKTRAISQRPLTAFEISCVSPRSLCRLRRHEHSHSANGEMLAYASSDLSVGVVNAKNLQVRKSSRSRSDVVGLTRAQPVLTILRAHEFPATTLKWSPSGDLVVSASADNSVRCISTSGPLPSSAFAPPYCPVRLEALRTAALAGMSITWTILVALLALLFGILVQYFLGDHVREVARTHLHL